MTITECLKAEKDVNGNWVLTRDDWQVGYRFINLILNGEVINNDKL